MADNNSDSIGALIELVERCEAATGPDRELDEAIADTLFPSEPFVQLADAPAGTGFKAWRQDGHVQSALRYTASLDAAMTLVPEGRDGVLMNCGVEGFHVSNKHRQHIARLFAPFSGERAEGRSITNAALALCAAALRAIAQTKSEGSQ